MRLHDPCLLDVFIAVVEFVNGGRARSWWEFTSERKRRLAARKQHRGMTPGNRGAGAR